MNVLELLHDVMQYVVEIAILIFEFIGIGVIICSGIKGFVYYIRKNPNVKLTLAHGLEIGLEFKLGSEILKTVIVREWEEILTVGAIIALRAALTFLIHWEIKEENKHKTEQEEKLQRSHLLGSKGKQ
ncbi:MAG: DUF1622 domain-containing protein [Lachnospiraceae bacterium]|nr:DUF1622 domain-containing protein [Lachnospiraceae bacterium]MBQ8547434.1 DUF1622 domain-containing protein [Lachnospiraceae bacterium]MBQ8845553.1 DUF1622 domain-containing protein [Lachnospiraceae bacterium]